MVSLVKSKQLTLLFGDIIVLYFSLGLTLFIRYGSLSFELWSVHFWPFTIIFIFWLLIFYIAGLYELTFLRNNIAFTNKFGIILLICGTLSVVLFYFVPIFGITPKTNLFIFALIFAIIGFSWRIFYNAILVKIGTQNKILLVGDNKTAQDLANHLEKNSQLGYEIKFWMKEGFEDKEWDYLAQIILSNNINLIVIPGHIKKNSKVARLIYKNLSLGIEVLDLAEIYEIIFRKIPLDELREIWFLENLTRRRQIYEVIKRPFEFILAVILGILCLPLAVLSAILIKSTSRGPIIYKQKRIGKNGLEFTIYKFRTMRQDAEISGPQWATEKDKRVIPIGKILRKTHLDELPQLINILKGELSLVGPRPERPEFVEQLKKEIPYYELRHLVKPGITGWAQTNFRYGASIEDAYEKLQYDIYYIKNRSLILDLLIILKTIRLFFVKPR
jgi:exopolysaccharide biosynthesis polyprenyl glycosylphosphotransferase